MGYVELPEGVRILGIIEVDDFDELQHEMVLELVDASGVPHFAVPPSERRGPVLMADSRRDQQ